MLFAAMARSGTFFSPQFGMSDHQPPLTWSQLVNGDTRFEHKPLASVLDVSSSESEEASPKDGRHAEGATRPSGRPPSREDAPASPSMSETLTEMLEKELEEDIVHERHVKHVFNACEGEKT
jgi:hypothetical protein